MSESPRPPVMDYRKSDHKMSQMAVLGTIMAAVSTFMGFFSLLILSDDAWKLAATFSAFGMGLAAATLRICGHGARRIFLWCLFGLSVTFFAFAILARFNLF
jgi:hypothetical protein